MFRDSRRVALLATLPLVLVGTTMARGQDSLEATPPEAGSVNPVAADVPEHEAEVLAALRLAPRADDIPLRATALHFPVASGESLVALVADLPAAAPSLRPAEGEPGTFTQDFTVLALVRDDSDHIVYQGGRRYLLSWGEDSLDNVKVGRVLFSREARLPPGRYTVEIAARDAQEGKLGVTRLPIDLPAIDEKQLRVSSLVIVGHAEPDASGEPGPLLRDGVRLFPNLGDPVVKSAGSPLTFLFTLQPSARPLASASVELLRDGSSILQSPVALPAPDEEGQMRVIGGLDVSELEPGDYILRLAVTNAQGFQTRTTPFKLVP